MTNKKYKSDDLIKKIQELTGRKITVIKPKSVKRIYSYNKKFYDSIKDKK